MSENALDEIERRLKDERYFSDEQVDVVMAVVEDELIGQTDREGADGYMTETGHICYDS